MIGKVYLVGAGPGDPELLTLKAVRALRAADVILHDDLVSLAVLEHARPEARIVAVGKRGGCASTPQDFITRLMIKEATAGHVVVRLKGGDPFVFGRGGEEQEALAAHGIEAEVVPGITAGLAASSALGIALTHRAASHGVAFVTGHGAGESSPDWRALAASGLTLVIYMGMSNAATIEGELRSAGMPPTMPIAVIQNASRPDQHAIVTRLERLAADIARHRLGSPAIMIVGDIVARRIPSTLAHAQEKKLATMGEL